MRNPSKLILAAFLVGLSLQLNAQSFTSGEYAGQTVTLMPQAPTSDDELVFRFFMPSGVLDTTFDASLSDQTIRLIGSFADTSYDGPDRSYDVVVGRLPPGVYAIEFHVVSFIPTIGPATLIDTAQLQITQGVSSAVRVPTLSGFGLVGLVVGVVLVAGFSRRL